LAAVLALDEESGALVLDVDGLEEEFMPEVALRSWIRSCSKHFCHASCWR